MGRPERPEHPGRPAGGRPEIPEAIPAPTAEIQVGQTTVEPAAPAQADQQPQPAPQAEPPVNTEEDLDALLREVRDLLAESPVPTLTQEQLEKPAQPVEEVAIQEEPEAEEAPGGPRPGGPPAAGPCRRTPGGTGAAPPGGGPPGRLRRGGAHHPHRGDPPHPVPLAGGRAGQARGRELRRRHR